jgi:L-alanine-DL-glutamate epimerase-like enolase superfamily enzyme
MKITNVVERTVPISRYAEASIPSGGLDTSAVAVVTDVIRNGEPVVGFGFSSIGRFGQGGLIRDRFAPRLLAAAERDLANDRGDNIDPFRAWACMMAGEKPGGHGERSVAVGTLDMAVWDAAAKIAGLPLYRLIESLTGRPADPSPAHVYAGGGYYYPEDDIARLQDETKSFLDSGFTKLKIKIGGAPLRRDMERIEAVLALLPGGTHLAVDAIYSYDRKTALEAAAALRPYDLWWFEDICDPLDFETLAAVAEVYDASIASGEALFSQAEAANLIRYGGLRPDRDIRLFDPGHCYGLPEFLRIVDMAEANGWPRDRFQPHGGHLFTLHLVVALGLGGAEVNPHNFQPFGGLADGSVIANGRVLPPDVPGIGFETRASLIELFRNLLSD